MPSSAYLCFDGDTLRLSSTLQILICRVPILGGNKSSMQKSGSIGYSRNYTTPQPYHLLDRTRALVAGLHFCCTGSLIDRPNVKKAIAWYP